MTRHYVITRVKQALSYLNTMSDEGFNLYIALLGVLCALIPVYNNNSDQYFASLTLDASYQKEAFQTGVLALILSTAPMAIDLILDGLFGLPTTRSKKYWLGRLVIFICVIVCAVFIRYNTLGDMKSSIVLHILVVFTCAKVVYANCILYCLTVADRRNFSPMLTAFVGATVVVAAILQVYANSSEAPAQSITGASQAITYIFFAQTMGICLRWAYTAWRKVFRTSSLISQSCFSPYYHSARSPSFCPSGCLTSFRRYFLPIFLPSPPYTSLSRPHC